MKRFSKKVGKFWAKLIHLKISNRFEVKVMIVIISKRIQDLQRKKSNQTKAIIPKVISSYLFSF